MKRNFVLGLALVIISALVMTACPTTPPPVTTPKPAPAPAPEPEPYTSGGIVLDGASNYTVVSGDTLADIAERRYGGNNTYYFALIRLANAGVVRDPDVIEVGTSLVIPDLSRNLNSDGAKAEMRSDMLSIAQQYDRQGKPNAAARLRSLASRLAK